MQFWRENSITEKINNFEFSVKKSRENERTLEFF